MMKIIINIVGIFVGVIITIGGVWLSAYLRHIFGEWANAPSFIMGAVLLIGGLALALCNCYMIFDKYGAGK